MKLSTKIFFVTSTIAAVLLINRARTASASSSVPDTTYVPQPGGSSTPEAIVTPMAYNQVWSQLGAKVDLWKQVLIPKYGVTTLNTPKDITDAAGHIRPDADLYPIQLISSVYVHGSEGDPSAFCAFPSYVFQTYDGYYISLLMDTGRTYSGQYGGIRPWLQLYGAALYDPHWNYMGKISNSKAGYNLVFDIHPPGSPEFKISDLGVICSIF